MNIRIHSADIQAMMKVAGACVDSRMPGHSAIEITHDNNILSIRANNGIFGAVASAPLMGGTGEHFCVDGEMFGKVTALCSGEITIDADDKYCTVKGTGRTRLPIVRATVPAFTFTDGGNTVVMKADAFRRALGRVDYAVATDNPRQVLTGVLMESDGREMKMTALDGFRLAQETADVVEGEAKIVAPGAFLKLVCKGLGDEGTLKIVTDGYRMTAEAPGMMVSCALLAGEYPDYQRIIPKEFKTEVLVNSGKLLDALKGGSVISDKQKLVKLAVRENALEVMNNGDEADYWAEVDCMTTGGGMQIAFNERYLLDALKNADAEQVVMKMGGAVSPVVICGTESGDRWKHLLLPVRVQ